MKLKEDDTSECRAVAVIKIGVVSLGGCPVHSSIGTLFTGFRYCSRLMANSVQGTCTNQRVNILAHVHCVRKHLRAYVYV